MKLNSTDIRSVKINEPKYAGTISVSSSATPQKLLNVDLPLEEGVVIYGPPSNNLFYTVDGLTASGIAGATFGTFVPPNLVAPVIFVETNNLNKVNIRLTSSGTVGIIAN